MRYSWKAVSSKVRRFQGSYIMIGVSTELGVVWFEATKESILKVAETKSESEDSMLCLHSYGLTMFIDAASA